MSFSVSILEDTASAMLKSVSENLQAKVHVKFLEIGHQMIIYASMIVPVRTGYLRSTIFFVAVEGLAYSFGASADYSLFVEIGTYRTRAQPFIQPTVEVFASMFLDAVVQAVMEACRA
ncbi:hypothetical protein MUP05_07740 [Candidatus Bathyarchaeota archaeon]|nr:hypothetical protein [Candidatus Bathyarchaeota archaeon]